MQCMARLVWVCRALLDTAREHLATDLASWHLKYGGLVILMRAVQTCGYFKCSANPSPNVVGHIVAGELWLRCRSRKVEM
jgi:hypothetical protein